MKIRSSIYNPFPTWYVFPLTLNFAKNRFISQYTTLENVPFSNINNSIFLNLDLKLQ